MTGRPYLIAISSGQPFDQAIIDSISHDDENVFVFDVGRHRLRAPGQCGWSKLFFKLDAPLDLRRRELASLLGEVPSSALCIGVEAADQLDAVLPSIANREVVLTASDLSFSSKRNPNRAKQMDALFRRSKRVFFEDQYLFHAAGDKGSRVPHFLLDVDPFAEDNVRLDFGSNVVGLVRVPGITDEQCLGVMQDIRRALPGHYVRLIEESDVFTLEDFYAGTRLSDAIQTCFGDLRALIFMGYSRNSQVIMRSLAPDARAASVAMDNFHLRSSLWDIPAEIELCPAYSLGASLAGRLQANSKPMPTANAVSVLTQIHAASAADVPDFFEDLLALRRPGPIDIYFSVTPIESHSGGARAQRVRNMLLSLRDDGRAIIDLSMSNSALERRTKLIDSEVKKGRQLGIFYGENSTSPISSINSIKAIENLISMVKNHGGKAGWFIRDLHFMDSEIYTSKNKENMASWARFEFAALSEKIDIFYVPTDKSGDVFRKYLRENSRQNTNWISLPPGMTGLAAPPVLSANPTAIGFVYTGGLGPIYKMDSYLNAVKKFANEADVKFDFIVRESEKKYLDEIADLGPSIRITTDEFTHYRGNARQLIGVSLLESDYAGAGFPLKIVNYAARSIPVMYFSGSSYAYFLRESDIGLEIKNKSDLIDSMQGLIDRARRNEIIVPSANFARAWERHSWTRRAELVRSQLSV